MLSQGSIYALIIRLWDKLSHRRRIQFIIVLGMMLVASVLEIISVGAILPFLVVLTEPNRVFYHPHAQALIQFLGVTTPYQLLLPLTICFGLAVGISAVFRLMLLWASVRLSFATGADISVDIYRRTLYQPYAVHVGQNSSEIINSIVVKTNSVIGGVIAPILLFISSFLILIAILIILFSINFAVSLITFVVFGSIYCVVMLITRKKKFDNSKTIAHESTQVIKCLQEGLGGIRDVLLDGNQEAYCRIYQCADRPLRFAQGNNQFVSQAPRYGIEALGMILIASLAYVLSQQHGGIVTALPLLGVLVLGAQRMLPLMQNVYASWSSIQASHASLKDTIKLLDQPMLQFGAQSLNQFFHFGERIDLKNIKFRYSEQTPFVIDGLNISIAKGSRIGFIGTTGSGKSTLLDIIMGLLEPTSGSVEIDGKQVALASNRVWQSHIAHVPQAIFLSDGTIEENIAIGQSKHEIDRSRVILAARLAQIDRTIESLPEGYQTLVGERGVRLSGGQRQRIGIARALYKKADVLVFDEATSALDNETERAVMEAIEQMREGVTVLIIAHRLTTLQNCSQIIELSNGKVLRMGTYQDLFVNNVQKY